MRPHTGAGTPRAWAPAPATRSLFPERSRGCLVLCLGAHSRGLPLPGSSLSSCRCRSWSGTDSPSPGPRTPAAPPRLLWGAASVPVQTPCCRAGGRQPPRCPGQRLARSRVGRYVLLPQRFGWRGGGPEGREGDELARGSVKGTMLAAGGTQAGGRARGARLSRSRVHSCPDAATRPRPRFGGTQPRSPRAFLPGMFTNTHRPQRDVLTAGRGASWAGAGGLDQISGS